MKISNKLMDILETLWALLIIIVFIGALLYVFAMVSIFAGQL